MKFSIDRNQMSEYSSWEISSFQRSQRKKFIVAKLPSYKNWTHKCIVGCNLSVRRFHLVSTSLETLNWHINEILHIFVHFYFSKNKYGNPLWASVAWLSTNLNYYATNIWRRVVTEKYVYEQQICYSSVFTVQIEQVIVHWLLSKC